MRPLQDWLPPQQNRVTALHHFIVDRPSGIRVDPLASATQNIGENQQTLANDAQLLTSRRYDPTRLFNGGLLHTHTASSPDGATSVVQVVNYGCDSPSHEVVLQMNRPVKSAKFHIPGASSPSAAT